MDQARIGQFIKAVRKERGLSQRDLAEKLNISDRTVSKWETGRGLPEVSLMLPLCRELQISVNELLSGERLDEAKYAQRAEENMLRLEGDTTRSGTKVAVCALSCALTLLCCLALALSPPSPIRGCGRAFC